MNGKKCLYTAAPRLELIPIFLFEHPNHATILSEIEWYQEESKITSHGHTEGASVPFLFRGSSCFASGTRPRENAWRKLCTLLHIVQSMVNPRISSFTTFL